MMIGLPESTEADDIKTAQDLIRLKPKIVRIYPVLVIKDTKLEEEYKNGTYEPLTVNQAVERCKEICYLFMKKKIKIIRIGLQSTETITSPNKESSEVVAGPYHETFRQLVETAIYYDTIENKIKKVNSKIKEVEIIVNPQDANNVIGYKKENINRLKELYDLDVVIKQDIKQKLNKIDVKPTKIHKDFIDDKEEVKIK